MGVELDKKSLEQSDNLRSFQNKLNLSEISYRIVGSTAVNSYINNLTDGNNSHTNLDIDLLVTRFDYRRLKSPLIREIFNNEDGINYDLSISKYIDFKPNDEFSFLIFRDIKFPIRSELFELRQNLFNKQQINTISAITLFHTFSVCGGVLRPKDWKNILLLGRYLQSYPDNKFSERDFIDFHRFLDIRKEYYPNDVWFLGKLQILLSYSPTPLQNIAWKIRKRIIKKYLGSSKNWE